MQYCKDCDNKKDCMGYATGASGCYYPNLTTAPIAPKENTDEISNPAHYTQGKYQPKDVIRDWKLNFNLGAAVKYIQRAGKKPDNPTLKDLRKAKQFLEFEIEALEQEGQSNGI